MTACRYAGTDIPSDMHLALQMQLAIISEKAASMSASQYGNVAGCLLLANADLHNSVYCSSLQMYTYSTCKQVMLGGDWPRGDSPSISRYIPVPLGSWA